MDLGHSGTSPADPASLLSEGGKLKTLDTEGLTISGTDI